MLNSVSIRTNILSNILFVVAVIASSLLGLEYYFSQQLAMSAAEKNFTQTVEKLTQILQTSDAMNKNRLYLSEQYPGLTLHPADPKHAQTIKRFASSMERYENIYAMYIGHANGDFFEVVNMHSSCGLHKHFQAPDQTRWTVIKIFDAQEGRIRRFDHYDSSFTLLESRSESSDYRANVRPWYTQAIQSDQAIRTDPYLFSNLQQQGITFAEVIDDSKAVLALDYTLTYLNKALHGLKTDESSEVMMFGRGNTIIASSNDHGPDYEVDTFLTTAVEKGQTDKLLQYTYKGIDKFAMVSTLSKEMGGDTHIGMKIDADVVLNPYIEKIAYSLGIALMFLMLSIPLILYATSRIVEPIKALMLENEKIKGRHFDEVTPIKTHVSELIDLSESLVSMSQSIQEYQKAQEELMDSFIKLIADAIDAKSPYTGGHCQRVPELAMILAKEADKAEEGPFKAFTFEDDDAWREFETGAWLHDCGKVTTPEYVVDKATKLETIHNRIHEIRTRFEVIWRDIEIEGYERLIGGEDKEAVAAWKKEQHECLIDDFNFIAECNVGGEFMSQDKRDRVIKIAQRIWVRHFDDRAGISDAELLRYEGVEARAVPAQEQLLSDRPEHIVKRVNFDEEAYREAGFKLDVPEHLYDYGEIYNLCIEKGTLTEEERFKIQEHVIMTIKMLECLPYPQNMKRIPEYAGTHHETMIGTGYPRQLSASDLSTPARIMVIADIFEALTASDRPYKRGKTLSEALQIMTFMIKDEHIDAELFKLFLTSGTYMEYAKRYLKPEQIDEVDIEAYM